MHDLLSEIINSCESLNGLHDFDALTFDWNLPKQSTVNVDDLNATLITPVKQIEESLATPETNPNQSKTKVAAAATTSSSVSSSPGPSNANLSYFNPNAISTPAARVNGQLPATIRTDQQQQQSDSFDSFDSTLLAPSQQISPSINGARAMRNSPQFVYQYPTNTESNPPILISTTHYQMQPIMINMSSGTNATSSIPSIVVSSFQSNENSVEIDRLNRQIQSGPVRSKRGYRERRSRFKNIAYMELENLDPNAIQPRVNA